MGWAHRIERIEDCSLAKQPRVSSAPAFNILTRRKCSHHSHNLCEQCGMRHIQSKLYATSTSPQRFPLTIIGM